MPQWMDNRRAVRRTGRIFDILSSVTKGRRFLASRLSRNLGGFLLLSPYLRVHLAGDPGVSRP